MPHSRLCSRFFFFFQAEDGIRDWSVTGVQTCALPIWIGNADAGEFLGAPVKESLPGDVVDFQLPLFALLHGIGRQADRVDLVSFIVPVRSEERRVGKEWGCGVWRCWCRESVVVKAGEM